MGRAARHIEGHVIMYADTITGSMKEAMDEIKRRRSVQEAYNKEHGVKPVGIKKAIKDITERVKVVTEQRGAFQAKPVSKEEIARLIKELDSKMRRTAKNLEFEQAAIIRDQIIELRRELNDIDLEIEKWIGRKK
jgi:excinuclease ABC subunit B